MTEPNSTPPAPREPGVDAVSAEYRRGFDDGWEMATSITVENVQESLAVLDAMIAEGEPCEHDTGHCSCKERAALESLRAHFAATDPSRALRVPAAPVSGEPDRVVRWEVTLRNVVSLVSGWQQGCAPGEWTDYDADVLSQLTALRKEVVDHLAALRAGGPTT